MSGSLSSVSSIPTSPSNTGKGPQTLTRRGGETEPSKSSALIRDPVLRAAYEAAYEGWARKYPELLGGLARVTELDMVQRARFWSKTRYDADTGCFNWTASRNKRGGYGRFRRNGKLEVAHRVAYEFGGVIPTGMTLDHRCRNTACVNPLHLEPVTVAENIRRGTQGWEQRAKTHCPRGHEYDVVNTYVNPRGQRLCRTCGRDRMRARRKALA